MFHPRALLRAISGSLINACVASAQWQTGLELFRSATVEPNKILLSTLVTCCEKGVASGLRRGLK